MKKTLSICLGIIFALALTFVFLPTTLETPVSAATSGTTGDCTWTLDGTVLTISGNGKLGDYTSSNSAPWGRSITEVVIESGVTNVGNYAFYDCESLTSTILPNGITSIGNYSFAFCSSLKSITIPSSVKTFGNSAFRYCYSLPGIIIPEGVTSIGDQAFKWCSKIKDIIIPDSVTSIGNDAFCDCSLKSIFIPKSVLSIGAGAFSWCSSLASIEVDENNTAYYSRNNCVIKKSTNALIAGCKTSVIPNSVTSIEEAAFNGYDFSSIIIPDSVTKIGSYAFAGCDLISITIPKGVTNIAYGAFYLCDKLTDVYYLGTRSDEEKINIGGNNSELTNAKWHYSPCENDAHLYDYICSTICKNCDYTRTATAEHIYDNNCDETCNVCSEKRTPTHTYVKNGENVATCKVCNLSKTFDFIITTDETITLSYEATKEFDFLIEDTSIAKISNVSSSIISSGSYYRQASSAKVLSVFPGETTVKIVATNGTVLTSSSLLVVEGEHQMQLAEVLKEVSCTEPGKELYICKFCGCEEEKTIPNPGHTYDDSCDTTCNVCNDIRTITHTYDNACDTTCNVCGATRAVPAHVYDNDEDTDCNVCGFVKYTPGDLDGIPGVSMDDAIYLLFNINFPGSYPVTQPVDFDGNGTADMDDAIYLLFHVNFPASYPLH